MIPQTNEELLQKILDAQEKGGCTTYQKQLSRPELAGWKLRDENADGMFGPSITYGYVLRIILDTDGCKAAYGVDGTCEWCGEVVCPFPACKNRNWDTPRFMFATSSILTSWHSGSGNSVRAALETAVSFLPKP